MLDNLQQIHLKLLQKCNSTAQAIGDLIDNIIADKFIKVSKTLQQNNLETVANENDKEIAKERCISLEERQKIIDNLRLK